MPFRDRIDAGRRLAQALLPYREKDTVILALPRGGVEVGAEIAHALNAPLDLLMVRKIGAPMHSELAVGAVIDGGLLLGGCGGKKAATTTTKPAARIASCRLCASGVSRSSTDGAMMLPAPVIFSTTTAGFPGICLPKWRARARA